MPEKSVCERTQNAKRKTWLDYVAAGLSIAPSIGKGIARLFGKDGVAVTVLEPVGPVAGTLMVGMDQMSTKQNKLTGLETFLNKKSSNDDVIKLAQSRQKRLLVTSITLYVLFMVVCLVLWEKEMLPDGLSYLLIIPAAVTLRLVKRCINAPVAEKIKEYEDEIKEEAKERLEYKAAKKCVEENMGKIDMANKNISDWTERQKELNDAIEKDNAEIERLAKIIAEQGVKLGQEKDEEARTNIKIVIKEAEVAIKAYQETSHDNNAKLTNLDRKIQKEQTTLDAINREESFIASQKLIKEIYETNKELIEKLSQQRRALDQLHVGTLSASDQKMQDSLLRFLDLPVNNVPVTPVLEARNAAAAAASQL